MARSIKMHKTQSPIARTNDLIKRTRYAYFFQVGICSLLSVIRDDVCQLRLQACRKRNQQIRVVGMLLQGHVKTIGDKFKTIPWRLKATSQFRELISSLDVPVVCSRRGHACSTYINPSLDRAKPLIALPDIVLLTKIDKENRRL